MPFIHRRGRLFLGREGGTYGTALNNATGLPGIIYGPLSGLSTTTLGAQASINGIAVPTLARDLEPMFGKHQSSMQLGRRNEDVAMVPGRRNAQGQFQVEITPDALGLLLLLAIGSDSVAATASTTLTGAGNTANATTITLAANSDPALADGQYLWINDGANSEYVMVNGAQSASATSIPIRGGAGTGGGLKFTHVSTTPLQVGPWTHTFTPSAGSAGSFQAEDNWGGSASSLLYTGLLIDSLELNAPIESDTEALTAIVKILGKAPSGTPVAASAAPSGIPLEEVPIGAGNSATLTATGATSTTVYVPDMKLTLLNTARLAKSQVSSPDPAFAIGTNFSLRGSMETIFEDYGVFQDFAANNIWSPVTLTYTWPSSLLKANPVVAASLAITIQRFAIEKAAKEIMKNDFVRYPIDAWRAEDYSDFTNITTWVLKNNVAAY
jgi:hypothetical protein